jgi:chorismate mutase/prephenate dehydratase
VLAVTNEPGSLVRCLEILAAADLNMGKLESRPSRERAWEYVFWVELDADAAAPATAAAITALRRAASMVRVLGSCPRAADPI